jgi:hypothetical protein
VITSWYAMSTSWRKPGAPPACRACGYFGVQKVLDLGELAMDLCQLCGLAQLACDGPAAGEVCRERVNIPQEHAISAIRTADAADLLRGNTVRQFGGSHGGSWLPLLTDLGFDPVDHGQADVVVDCFGSVHDADQRAALQRLANATSPAGVLLLQFQSVADLVQRDKWNFLRRGHFAYYSLTALVGLLGTAGMSVATAWQLDVHGDCVMLAAIHARHWPADPGVTRILEVERQLKITTAEAFSGLQMLADR